MLKMFAMIHWDAGGGVVQRRGPVVRPAMPPPHPAPPLPGLFQSICFPQSPNLIYSQLINLKPIRIFPSTGTCSQESGRDCQEGLGREGEHHTQASAPGRCCLSPHNASSPPPSHSHSSEEGQHLALESKPTCTVEVALWFFLERILGGHSLWAPSLP